jgi:hypothetical protein
MQQSVMELAAVPSIGLGRRRDGAVRSTAIGLARALGAESLGN